MTQRSLIRALAVLVMLSALGVWQHAHAQFDRKWLSAGSLHTWYAEVGS